MECACWIQPGVSQGSTGQLRKPAASLIQKTFQVSPTAFQAQGLRRDNFSPRTKAWIIWEAKHNQNQQGGWGLFLLRAAE